MPSSTSSAAAICNRAIGHCQLAGQIDGELADDTSAEGMACAEVYEALRDELLAAHDWPWATKQAALQLLFEVADLTEFERNDWLYCYALPSDYLKLRGLWPGMRAPSKDWQVPHAIENYSSDDVTEQTVLFTDLEASDALPVVMRYTRQVTDVNLFPPSFVNALALRIAFEIASQVKKDHALTDRLERRAQVALLDAIAHAKNSEQQDQPAPSKYLRVRG